MKKLFFTIMLLSFMFCFTGCNEDSLVSSENDDLATFNKAGTALTYPNTFDAEGILCVLGDNKLQGELGTPMEIWMGVGNEKAGNLVGRVIFDGADVIIDLTDADNDGTPDMYPYVVTLVHLDFAKTFAGLPQTKQGNPIPGQFETHKEADPYATKLVIKDVIGEFDRFGAIHMEVVKYGGIEGFEFYLPNQVQMKIARPGITSSTFMTILNGGFMSDFDMGYGPGVYESWCVDLETGIASDRIYDSNLYSSYEDIPDGIVDKPENLDLINYLINNFKVGQIVQPLDNNCDEIRSPEPLTRYDIQQAIWYYIDDKIAPWSWNEGRRSAIICDVDTYGNGFVPVCDQKIVFLVVPAEFEHDFQIIIGYPNLGEIEVPCETEEGTAWGDGYFGATFPGKQWGTWFQYDENCIPN